jgi:hypothetical protein
MAVNTTFVSGAILTASQMNNLPWGQVGLATKTTDQAVTTKDDLAGLSVTFTAVAGRVYEASLSINIFANTGLTDASVFITDGTTDYMESLGSVALNQYQTRTLVVQITGLTAGSKTIKAQASSSVSAQFYGTGIRASIAGKMIVKDIGAA